MSDKSGDRPHFRSRSRKNMSVQQLERKQLPTFYSQKAEEHASRVLETHRIPDPYYFLVDRDGDLFSPSAHVKVKTVTDTSSKIGILEAEAVEAISKWANNADSGAIAWLSPPSPGIYPVSKVIISEIEEVSGVKRVFNRAVVLDIDANECLRLGRELSQHSTNRPFLQHLDQLRSIPVVLDTKNRTWIEIMEEVIPDTTLWESVRRGDEILVKQEVLARAELIITKYSGFISFNNYGRDREMQGMLGDKSESCPPKSLSSEGQTAFQVFSENSLEADSMGSLSFPCPSCGFINKRPREGYVESCQNPSCTDPAKVRC